MPKKYTKHLLWNLGAVETINAAVDLLEQLEKMEEQYLKFFNLHHTLAVNEAGIKGILCDALKIEHYQHDLYELSQMVTAQIDTKNKEYWAIAEKQRELLEGWDGEKHLSEQLFARAQRAEGELSAFKEENAYLLDKLSPLGRDFDPVKERDAAYDLGWRDERSLSQTVGGVVHHGWGEGVCYVITDTLPDTQFSDKQRVTVTVRAE